jgi:hypothetical protein
MTFVGVSEWNWNQRLIIATSWSIIAVVGDSNQIVCNLINVAVQFSDSPKGSGGFVVIPGSHKSNFPSLPSPEAFQELADTFGIQPECELRAIT